MLSSGYKHNIIQFLELTALPAHSEKKIKKVMLYSACSIEDKIGNPDFFEFSLQKDMRN